jgi:hypothetical protein
VSTHSTILALDIAQGVPGKEDVPGSVNVSYDIGVDLCVRLCVDDSEIHLNPDQAEDVAKAMLHIVAMHRRQGNDPTWAARTIRRWTDGYWEPDATARDLA